MTNVKYHSIATRQRLVNLIPDRQELNQLMLKPNQRINWEALE